MNIINIYQSYDEDALKTYANAGILRRAKKDVIAQKVTMVQTDQDIDKQNLIICKSDGQLISLPAKGLTYASCDCSSVSACKHIIASVLYLQTIIIEKLPDEKVIEEGIVEKEMVEKEIVNKKGNEAITKKENTALSEILALDITDLKKIAKTIPKAKRLKSFNMALHYFELNKNKHTTIDNSYDQTSNTTITNDNYSLCIKLSSQFEKQVQDIRYIAGAGFSGMLSKIEKDAIAYHLLALLAVHQVHGESEQFIKIEEWLQQELQKAGESTHSQAANIANAFQLSSSNVAMLDDLEFDIHQLLNQGLSHVDTYSANRMHLANTIAHSHHLPRLATMLRQISGLMHDFVHANNHINERKLLQLLAHVSVYMYQLRHSNGKSLQTLRGKLRQRYESNNQQPSLTLYPLGAKWWQSQGKARGLTLYFYQVNEVSNNNSSNDTNTINNTINTNNGKIIEFTQARGQAKDPSFDKNSAWYNSVWLSTSERLMSQKSILENPRFRDDSFNITSDVTSDATSESTIRNDSNGTGNQTENAKLAVTGSKVVNSQSIQSCFSEYQDTISSFAEDDWQHLDAKWRQQLAADGKVNPLVVLNPAKIGGLLIDEVEQCVWWQLADDNDSQIRLRLDWQGNNQNMINKIKNLENIDRHHIKMVVAHVHMREQFITLEPITLVMTDKLFHLDYDVVRNKKSTLKELLSGKISKLVSKKRRLLEVDERKPMTVSELVCEPILQVLESLSATGRLHPTNQHNIQLQGQVTLARDSGLSIIARELETLLAMNQQDVSKKAYINQLLYLVYICQLLRLLEIDVPILNVSKK